MKRVKQAAKNYFIPQAENDYKPQILRARSIAFMIMIALVAEFDTPDGLRTLG